jgi:hypothetical protein
MVAVQLIKKDVKQPGPITSIGLLIDGIHARN